MNPPTQKKNWWWWIMKQWSNGCVCLVHHHVACRTTASHWTFDVLNQSIQFGSFFQGHQCGGQVFRTHQVGHLYCIAQFRESVTRIRAAQRWIRIHICKHCKKTNLFWAKWAVKWVEMSVTSTGSLQTDRLQWIVVDGGWRRSWLQDFSPQTIQTGSQFHVIVGIDFTDDFIQTTEGFRSRIHCWQEISSRSRHPGQKANHHSPELAWELKSFHSLGTGVAVKLYGLLAAEALKINGLPGPKGVVGCDKLEKLWIGPAKKSLHFFPNLVRRKKGGTKYEF